MRKLWSLLWKVQLYIHFGGYTLDTIRKGIIKYCIKNNMPKKEFAYLFLKFCSSVITSRICQNIKKARATISLEQIKKCFQVLEASV